MSEDKPLNYAIYNKTVPWKGSAREFEHQKASLRLANKAAAAEKRWLAAKQPTAYVPTGKPTSHAERRLRGILSGYQINVRGGPDALMKCAAVIFHITGFGNDIEQCLAKLDAVPRKTKHKYALAARKE